jgi:hypothetical protein
MTIGQIEKAFMGSEPAADRLAIVRRAYQQPSADYLIRSDSNMIPPTQDPTDVDTPENP